MAEYRSYVLDQVRSLQEVVRPFTDAVRAGDLEGAKAAYAPSRVPFLGEHQSAVTGRPGTSGLLAP